MRNAFLTLPLLAVGVLTAGCNSSSTPSTVSASVAVSPASPASAVSVAASPAATPGASTPAAGAASASASAGSATLASGPVPCKTVNLQVSLGGGPGAGMDQNRLGLQLRNIGSSTCTLYGYPGVAYVAGADGHQVGAAAVRQPDSGASEKVVTLAPNALASAPIDFVAAAVVPRSACKPVPVRGLRVYPPGQTAALFLPDTSSAGGYGECSVPTNPATLAVGYLQAGAQPGGGDQG